MLVLWILKRQWNRKRLAVVSQLIEYIWIRNFYIFMPIFLLVWSFKIPYMVYELFFATMLTLGCSDKIKEKLGLKFNDSGVDS